MLNCYNFKRMYSIITKFKTCFSLYAVETAKYCSMSFTMHKDNPEIAALTRMKMPDSLSLKSFYDFFVIHNIYHPHFTDAIMYIILYQIE